MEQYNFLDQLEKLKEEKNLDEIGELLLSVISIYSLTVDEVAALSYYMFNQALMNPTNVRFIEDNFYIDVNDLGIEGKLSFMQALVAAYVEKISNE
ncbi:hypothetical protein IGK74_002377 [Enterococcus sp. AZ150]|uniref:hypothetical protein n=1 Tax=Enterococcus sp. AZ150 TaxID=2774866 RepID=UPI003F277163